MKKEEVFYTNRTTDASQCDNVSKTKTILQMRSVMEEVINLHFDEIGLVSGGFDVTKYWKRPEHLFQYLLESGLSHL